MANHHDIMAKLRRHIVKTKTYTWRREYKTCRKYNYMVLKISLCICVDINCKLCKKLYTFAFLLMLRLYGMLSIWVPPSTSSAHSGYCLVIYVIEILFFFGNKMRVILCITYVDAISE